MAEKKDDAPPPPDSPTPAPEPPPEARPRFVRFDFPPGATPEEIAKGIRELAERHLKPKP